MKYIDLFSGLGAFHTAFSDGFECVFACDIDAGARRIYEANYGLIPASDIREVVAEDVPDHDILCAGFPCQPFSIAGNGEGFADTEKGNLFVDILRIVDAKGPRMCILENVKNLETHDEGRTYATIKEQLELRGYTVVSKVMNAAKYGSPQCRQRIFIVATQGAAFEFPAEHVEPVPVSAILDPEETRVWDSSGYELVAKTGNPRPFNPHVVFDVVNSSTHKGGRQGERVYSVDAPGITVCASSGGPGAKTGLNRVNNGVRRLNVKETLGMFGFPATFQWADMPTEKCLFYLGNSIVVNVVRACVPSVVAWFRQG